MDLKKINNILSNLDALRNIGNQYYKKYTAHLEGVKLISTTVEHKIENSGYDGGEQGVEGVSHEIYKLPFDDLFLRIEIRTDSYGDNERISKIQFVKETQKTVSVYEEL